MSDVNNQNDNNNVNNAEVEIETDPLLPLWLSSSLYSVFGLLCLIAAIWIPWKTIQQHRTFNMLEVIQGPWENSAPDMDSEEVTDILDFFKSDPQYSLLFITQELVRDPIEDERMAKVEALRKAKNWGENAAIRALLVDIIENMESDGSMPRDYTLDASQEEVLSDLVDYRHREWADSYEARRITEVLEWVADGRPTHPLGPERRRLMVLRESYEKRLFVGEDRQVLRQLKSEWSEAESEIKRSLADKFAIMLDDDFVALSEQEMDLCRELNEENEILFLKGRSRVSDLGLMIAEIITEQKLFIDHPQIYEFCYLLKSEHPPVADNIREILFLFRWNRFTLRFLEYILRQDTVNPVLAVETERLTTQEHRALLRHETTVRRRSAVDVLKRIAIDYYNKPFEIHGIAEDETENYVRRHTVLALGRVGEDPAIGDYALEALDVLQSECPDWF